jgi:molybdopterin molybdotransferase
MTLFLPVRLHAAESGKILADPVEVNGSGDLAGITQSDGFIELPSDRAIFEDGSSWPLYRWE